MKTLYGFNAINIALLRQRLSDHGPNVEMLGDNRSYQSNRVIEFLKKYAVILKKLKMHFLIDKNILKKIVDIEVKMM